MTGLIGFCLIILVGVALFGGASTWERTPPVTRPEPKPRRELISANAWGWIALAWFSIGALYILSRVVA